MSDEKLMNAISDCQEDVVMDLVNAKIAGDQDLAQVLDDLSAGLKVLGERFAAGKAFIPELVYAGEIFSQVTEILKPKLGDAVHSQNKKARVVIATVKGDLHDIGKNLVGTFLDMGGYDVIDLGHDVANEDILRMVKERRPAVVGLSALLTTTMFQQREVVKMLADEGLKDDVRVVVGGAPATQAWADEIGADAFGADAVDGKTKIDSLLGF